MALPVEVLLGIYLGLLTGIVPAFVSGTLGFLVRYVTGVTLPSFGVVVLALSIASVQGGLLGLVEPTIARSPRLFVAVLVVLMLALYAHNQGDRLGAELPRHVSLTQLRKRTLSADVVEMVGGIGHVTVRPHGGIADVEGYPPLSPDLRATLAAGTWRLPADLPLAELETRLEERLRTDHDLADVAVSLDERGRATIAAAPPTSALSKRVPEGQRAVSLATPVPTGLARGDEVDLRVDGATVRGTVLSARGEADERAAAGPDAATAPVAPDETGEAGEGPVRPDRAPGTATAGGPGRVTVAVARREARTVLGADRPAVIVRSRGTSREFEALSLLRRAGDAIRRVAVGSTAAPTDGVQVLAVRRGGSETGGRRRGWVFVPGIERPLEPGDEAFVAGSEDALEAFTEAAR
ncbi:TrkA C-terminal domain-containing protein [Salinilacihabitans rarus]|uniref:TrkA C-terminal domain-containing protein n=1 Tax=Salinilacihabitans rarus TaxID=2961596 RepID=UPI0020C8439F|nr:TrkA C-terminal domain-containing protein [Salinilacihabitans rarus]